MSRLQLIPLLCLALAACGGDDSDSGEVAPNESAAGLWSGTVTTTGETDNAACLIATSNELACILTDPGTGAIAGAVHGTIEVTDGNQVTGSGSAYAAPGFVLADGSTFADATMSGSVSERVSLDLEASAAGSVSTVNLTYNPEYERGASLGAVEGVYTGFAINGESASFTIDADGAVFAQSSTGCVGSGQIEVRDSSVNEYGITLELSSCGALDGSYSGLAVTGDAFATDDELAFAIFSGTRAIVGAVVE